MTTDDSVARQLLHQAETIAELRREVERLAHESTDTLADVLVRLESIEETSSIAPPTLTSWCWRYAGPEARERLQTALNEWVAWIRHRYPLARRIPDCWAEHSEVVE